MKDKNRIVLPKTLKHILTLFTGTAVAQAIPLLVSPFISRIYTDTDFANFADYISIFNLVAVLSTGRYSLAIVVAKDDKEAVNIMSLSILITVIVSLVSLLIMIPFHNLIGVWLGNSALSQWLFFIPLGVLFFGLFEALSYWLNRHQRYKLFSSAKVVRGAGIASVNLNLGLAGFKKAGLILGQITGDFLAGILATIFFFRKDRAFLTDVSKAEIKRMAKKYKEFPLFNSVQAFSDRIRESSVILLISSFFTESVSGSYFFGFNYGRAPLTILIYSLFQVFYQKFSEKKNKGEALSSLFKRILRQNILISVFLFVGIFFLAEPAFAFVFGEPWRTAGFYLHLLAPMLAINFLTGTIAFLPFVLNKQNQFLRISFIYNISVPLSIYFVTKLYKDIEITILTQSIVGSLSLLIILLWLIYVVKQYDADNQCVI